MRVVTGSYVGNGRSRIINLAGLKPALIIIKASGQKAYHWHDYTWGGYPQHFSADASDWAGTGIRVLNGTRSGFQLANDAKVNGAGTTYYYTCFYRDDAHLFTGNWAGNNALSRTIDFGFGTKPALLVEKRDSARAAIAYTRFSGTGQCKRFDAVAEADYINSMASDGSFVTTPTSGNLPWVNEATPTLGEAMNTFAFMEGADVYSVSYTGNGTTQNISLPFNAAHVFIVPRTSDSITQWNKSLPATNSFDGEATAFYTDRITSVDSSVTVGNSAAVNTNGTTYYLIAIKDNPNADLYSESLTVAYANKGYIFPSTETSFRWLSCSNSDATLKITGAISLEWWGTPRWARSGTSGEAYLLVRQNGGTATPAQGSFSYGFNAYSQSSRGQWSLDVITSNFYDRTGVSHIYDVSTSTDTIGDVRTKWRTGLMMPTGIPVHIIATFDGTSLWKLYVNGKLRMLRDINLADGNLRFGGASAGNAGSPVLTNIASNTADYTSINLRYAAGVATQNANNRFEVYQASVYNSTLTASQVLARYRKSVLNDSTQTDATPSERWNFTETSGGTIAAQINAANNGTGYNTGTPSVFNGSCKILFNKYPH